MCKNAASIFFPNLTYMPSVLNHNCSCCDGFHLKFCNVERENPIEHFDRLAIVWRFRNFIARWLYSMCVLFHTRAGIARPRGHMIANRGHVDEGGHACTILCPYHCHRHQNRRQNETIACHVVNSNRGHFNESEHAGIIRAEFSVSIVREAIH